MKKNILGLILELIGFVAFVFGLFHYLAFFIDTPFFISFNNNIEELLPISALILLEVAMPFILIIGLVVLIFGKIICLLADIEHHTRLKRTK